MAHKRRCLNKSVGDVPTRTAEPPENQACLHSVHSQGLTSPHSWDSGSGDEEQKSLEWWPHPHPHSLGVPSHFWGSRARSGRASVAQARLGLPLGELTLINMLVAVLADLSESKPCTGWDARQAAPPVPRGEGGTAMRGAV